MAIMNHLNSFIHTYFIYQKAKIILLNNHQISLYANLLHHKYLNKFLKIYLNEFTAIDFPFDKPRYRLIQSFLNYQKAERINAILTTVNQVISLSDVYPSAGWAEREIFDNYGIFFEKHKDLRRLLSDYGFPYFPLRKDYPLQGYQEVFYSLENKRIAYSNVEFQQAFRLNIKRNPFVELW